MTTKKRTTKNHDASELLDTLQITKIDSLVETLDSRSVWRATPVSAYAG